MKREQMRWKVISKNIKGKLSQEKILTTLLVNRGLVTKKQKKEFLTPKTPDKISLKEVELKVGQVTKAVSRIRKAKKNKEMVIVYGDYDADGVCATAIMWETLHYLGVKAMPYIPERFSEGYGINSQSIDLIQKKYKKVSLIITVDNGIVAHDAITYANKKGIDVIITDHHEKGKTLPKAKCIIHTTKTSGAGLAWFLARELRKKMKNSLKECRNGGGLDLATIGTISDQIPLLGINRSLVKYGLKDLQETQRIGLKKIYEEASVLKDTITTYDVGFVIAPRINAMGRLEHAIDSLRLLCTTDGKRAEQLAYHLGKVNKQRQKIVDEVMTHARGVVAKQKLGSSIVIADNEYHEGVIGLAASKLVEEFYRPSIVLSKGKELSKASARSIPGINIIDVIRKLEKLHLGGGGHSMAAGFSIRTKDIQKFRKAFEKEAAKLLSKEILTRSMRADMHLPFLMIGWDLAGVLKKFEPAGLGNPAPVFVSENVEVVSLRGVGNGAKHLKLKLQSDGKIIDAIAFGMGELAQKVNIGDKIDVVYSLEENAWNGNVSLQLKIKDIKL